MRFAWLSALLVGGGLLCQAQINPHQQIRWPAGCSASSIMTYNPLTDNCIAATGTAANPAGSPKQVQFNLSGVFGADANFTWDSVAHILGLGSGNDTASGHQAATANGARATLLITAYGGAGDLQYKNFTNTAAFTGSMTSGGTTMTVGTLTVQLTDVGKYVVVENPTATPFTTVTYAGQLGYTNNNVAQIVAVNTGLNQYTLSKTAANTFSGNIAVGTDNGPAMLACQTAVNTLFFSQGSGNCRLPDPGQYLFATANGYAFGTAFDPGSYGQDNYGAGGSGATVTPVMSNGQIASCSVSGGTLYTPSSTLQTSITGGCSFNAAACGQAFITVGTNGSGVPNSCTVVWPGFGYSSTPTVTVTPLAGDGAAATATVSGGAITVALSSGGAGYKPSLNPAIDWYALTGTSGCNSITGTGINKVPVAAYGTGTSNSLGQISSLTITQNATGCPGPAAPVIVFGPYACNTGTASSPVYGQCANMAPLTPVAIPVAIYTGNNVGIVGGSSSQGSGSTIYGTDDGASVDNNQLWMMGGYIQHQDIKNLTFLNSFGGIWAQNNVNFARLSELNFNNTWGMYSESCDVGSAFRDLSFTGYTSWINGGNWAHRDDFPKGLGGFCDPLEIKNIVSNLQAYGGPGSRAQKIRDYYDQNVWLSAASANSPDFPETCKSPATPAQRQTGPSLNPTLQGYTANSMCERGVTGIGMAMFTRDARTAGTQEFSVLTLKGGSGPIFCCDGGGMKMSNFTSEGTQPITGSNDPYRSATQLEGGVIFIDNGSSSGAAGTLPQLDTTNFNGTSQPNRSVWSITNQGDPVNTRIYNNFGGAGTNAQANELDIHQSISDFQNGIRLGFSNQTAPIDGWGPLGVLGVRVHTGQIVPAAGGWQLTCWNGSTLINCFEATATAVNAQVAFSACNPSSTSNCALFNASALTAGRTVTVPDAASSTIQGAGGATSGDCVQYVDTSGVQHYTPCASLTRLTLSLTPAAATTSQCVEQTFTATGLAAGETVTVSPPGGLGPHLWIGWSRVSAVNVLAIGFCADATGGTPPSGNYFATQ